MTATKKTSWFAPKLREALDRTDTSVRGLSKSWRPSDPETARRTLIRYLNNGIVPGAETRREIAEVLGVDGDELEQDDEESDPVVDLMKAVEAIVRRQIRKALEDEYAALTRDKLSAA